MLTPRVITVRMRLGDGPLFAGRALAYSAGMKTLFIMRHAKSSWDNPSQEDHERPLNERGRRDAPRMGKWLCATGAAPALIVSSSARRASETAELVLQECAGVETRIVPQLYHATPADWVHVLRSLPDSASRVLCIGHNPGIEEFLRSVSGQVVPMPTAAIARLELAIDSWSRFDPKGLAEVREVRRPRELDASDE